DNSVHLQFLDGLQVRAEFYDSPSRRQVSVSLAIAIAQMDVNGLALESLDLGRAAVGKDEVTNVDVGPDPLMIAFIDETNHGVHIVEQAEPKGFQLEGKVDFLFVGVIAQKAASVQPPLPLGFRRDDFALPNVFTQDHKNIFRGPGSRKVDEFFSALEMEIADGFLKIDEARSGEGERY